MMEQKNVTILCSGFGLGFYIIGLLLDRRFKQKGISSEVCVFESLMTDDKIEKVKSSRKVYHRNFSAALMSTRMLLDTRQSLDEKAVDDLLESWKQEGRTNFIVLSGHWMHIIQKYREIAFERVNVDIIYTDSDLAPSWKSVKTLYEEYNRDCDEIWLFDSNNRSVEYQIPVSDSGYIPFSRRNGRYVIHGGGWGMGTYRERIRELEEAGIPLDIIGYEPEEAADRREGNRYFVNDPSWTAWNRNKSNVYEFPPLAEVKDTGELEYRNNFEYHVMFDLIREAKAIISKTGGGSLVDSLASATPIIMLEPFGEHEQKNAELWEYLGFGIPYGKWKESGFSGAILEDMHRNLLKKRKECRDYTDYYAERYSLEREQEWTG
ncbi:MAG TPA: UDP-glucuronosyltransferase [Clostridia bacterium]|nr:UDP-glucuronosyltransferase [Clostridia bacterium]